MILLVDITTKFRNQKFQWPKHFYSSRDILCSKPMAGAFLLPRRRLAMDQIYADIAARTGGNIYVGVVGPVRTGKSTLIKRIMEELVIPGISDPIARSAPEMSCPRAAPERPS